MAQGGVALDAWLWRGVVWLVRWFGVRTLLVWGLLAIPLIALAVQVSRYEPALDLLSLCMVGLGGLVLAWFFRVKKAAGWKAGVALVAGGFTVVFAWHGRLGVPLLKLGQAFATYAWDLRALPGSGAQGSAELPAALVLLAQIAGLGEHLAALVRRVGAWLAALFSGAPASDPFVLALAWGLVFWLLGAWAGWASLNPPKKSGAAGSTTAYPTPSLFVAPAVLPVLLILLLSQPGVLRSGRPEGSGFWGFWLALVCGLFLQALFAYEGQARRWAQVRARVATIEMDYAVMAVVLAAGWAGAAYALPEILNDTVAKIQAYVDERSPWHLPIESSTGTGSQALPYRVTMPTSQLLGSGPELSKAVVMAIQVEGYRPSPGPTNLAEYFPPPQHGWRSRIFDVYHGRGWVSGALPARTLLPGEPAVAEPNPLQGLRIVQHQVTWFGTLPAPLYSAGELYRVVDQPSTVVYALGAPFSIDTPPPWGEFSPAAAEVNAAFYSVESYVLRPAASLLRQSGPNYPDWVRARYLALPETLPDRVRQLALDLTVPQPTPYDQALAIEGYLRSIPYTLDLPEPPPGVDLVDYYLFDLQRGYCDYAATAMVVLARAAGLPARLVSGYASGQYSYTTQSFIVTEADAHAWVEVYFTGVGWVEFEPTGGRAGIVRVGDDSVQSAHPGLVSPPFPDADSSAVPAPDTPGLIALLRAYLSELPGGGWAWLLGSGVVVAALAGWGWTAWVRWHLRRLPPKKAAAALFHSLYDWGAILGIPSNPARTPSEFTRLLVVRCTPEPSANRWVQSLSGYLKNQIDLLAGVYEASQYSPSGVAASELRPVVAAWPRTRLVMWSYRAWLRLKSPGFLVFVRDQGRKARSGEIHRGR